MWRNGTVNYDYTPTIINDDNWHIAIVECDSTLITQLRLDIEAFPDDFANGAVPSMEIAYLGFATDLDALIKSIKAYDSSAADACDCSQAASTFVSDGRDTHSSVCQLCGKAADPLLTL